MTLSTSILFFLHLSPLVGLFFQDLGPEAHRISSVQATGPKELLLLQRCAISVHTHARAAAAPGGCEGTTAAQSTRLVGSSLNGLLVMSEKVVMVEEGQEGAGGCDQQSLRSPTATKGKEGSPSPSKTTIHNITISTQIFSQ